MRALILAAIFLLAGCNELDDQETDLGGLRDAFMVAKASGKSICFRITKAWGHWHGLEGRYCVEQYP